jgi:hypothetical protein
MWANQKDMMKYDHTKPAPCISHQTLLFLRSTLSIGMLVATIAILIITNATSLVYLSQWSLLLTTLTFGLLALAQIRSQKHRMEEISFSEHDVSHDPNQITTLNSPYSSYKWIVFFYQLAFSLNWVVFLFFFYVFFFDILNPDVSVAWWNAENNVEHYA